MVTLIERYLTEDIDAVRKQYPDIPEDLFYNILKMDPTYREGSNSVGKYGKWLLTVYKKNPISQSYILNRPEIVENILRKYDEYKNDRTKAIEKDISRFSSINDMAAAVDNVGEAEMSDRQKSRQAKKDKPYDMVFNGENYAVFVPKNHEGDMVLASFGNSKKATWCTAADSDNGIWRYDYYLQQGGKYYVLINKTYYNEKYQFHFESKQFMDTHNSEINLEKFFEKNEDLKEFFEDEGYDVEEYYEEENKVPEDEEQQIEIIAEYFEGIGTSEMPNGVFYSVCEYKGIFDDIIDEQADYFYDWDTPKEQFDMLKDVGLLDEYDVFEDVPEEKRDYLWEYRDEYGEAYRNLYDDCFSNWFESMHGEWERLDYRTKRDILNQWYIDANDIAKCIVYDMGQGYEYCEDILGIL